MGQYEDVLESGMLEKRKQPRYVSLARVRIPQAGNTDILLKDISITGCGIESTMMLDLILNNPYKMEILPEAASEIGRFELVVEPSWIRAAGYSFEAGFVIVESPKGRQFQRYVDYLSWRQPSPAPAES
jgi:hypothetical protein